MSHSRFPFPIASLGAQPAKLSLLTIDQPRGLEVCASLRGYGSTALLRHSLGAVTRILPSSERAPRPEVFGSRVARERRSRNYPYPFPRILDGLWVSKNSFGENPAALYPTGRFRMKRTPSPK